MDVTIRPMKTLKTLLFTLYVAIIVIMGAATIIEKYHGTAYVRNGVYGSWWFTVVWALLAAVATVYFLRRRVRIVSAVCLHLSFVFILLGSLLTHLTSTQGVVHLRQGETISKYLVEADNDTGYVERNLPFSLSLNTFDIIYHEGTAAVRDYETTFTLADGNETQRGEVSMNNIFSYRGYRLYQSSYDQDQRGSILSLNRDVWGIPVTYCGYALLFVSLVWMLFDPRGTYRRLLSSPLLKKGLLSLLLLLSASLSANAATTLSKETAERFGKLYILYNDRICPMQTFAIDFTKKLCGRSSYNGLTAEQVLTGFIFYGGEWCQEPVIRLKDGAMKETLQLPDHVSVNTFFNRSMGGYIIGSYVEEYYQGQQDKFHKQVADVDDALQLVMALRHGALLKIFPYTEKGVTTWYAPTDALPATVNKEHRLYINNVFPLLYSDILAGRTDRVNETLDKMLRYQEKYGGASLPSPLQVKAERLYNAIPFATLLFMFNLAVGILSLFAAIFRLTKKKMSPRHERPLLTVLMAVSLLSLTVCLALRWIVSGKIPMANGYETMLLVAWLVMIASLVASHRFRIVLPFGFLMSGFFLLVSHIGQMSPNIGHVMPVLNSPLLSIHVSVIMMAFALLSLTFVCGLTALALSILNGHDDEQQKSLQLLSRLFLSPALTLLGIGIFIGAIWANVSWGNYWGWDPKEVWALITFMVYAVAVHTASLPHLAKPTAYHIYMVLSFLTILMTYFGVNYFLGGMHSYA